MTKTLLTTALLAIALPGCFLEMSYYDVYGSKCASGTPTPGCDFYSDGSKLTADDYFGYKNSIQTKLIWGDWTYNDSYGNPQSYWGWGYRNDTGIIFDENGNALNSADETSGRDLIGNYAALEEATILSAGKDFAARHALAESVGISIARTLNQMATLPKRLNRSRTTQDLRDFTQRLYGVDLDRVTSAADQAHAGDLTALKAINSEIARNWGTQPETSEAILRTWYGDMLSN